MASSENVIDEIKSRCNIVDVIGRTVSLKKTGSNHKGLCPFHNEKTPSFVVSEDKQIFTCFGCGATGDVIEFVMRLNNWDFREAAEHLAAECGITLPEHQDGKETKRNELYEINRQAALFFYRAFETPGNPGRAYMEKRGIDAGTLKRFGIGYADDGWDSLCRYFSAIGTDAGVLSELGLITKSKDRYYDKFRNRVMFPIINTRGKVIGFGGRAIGDDKPKYLNSQESSIFLKKLNLYGLNLARQEIASSDFAIIVEGYMDVISLHQHGVKNAVASLGTALTSSQAAMIRRYTDNVILSYDADEAGAAASLRGMDILAEAGCKVRILQIPDGKDPDEFIKKHGRDAFMKAIRDALPLTDYKISRIRKISDMSSTEGKLDFVKKVTPVLKALKSPVEADMYIKMIAAETKISEGALHLEVFGTGIPKSVEKPVAKSSREKSEGENEFLEKNLIKLALTKAAFIPEVMKYRDIFSIPGCRSIFETICALYKEDEEIDVMKVADSLSAEDNGLLSDIMENIRLAGKEDIVFEDCMGRIRRKQLIRRQEEILSILQMADEDSDEEMIRELTRELMDIQNKTRYRF